ncbi:MAG TPA: EfeM/EfeO family lipoprotein, partial [Amycolatopsis sp.]|nr:EfeM/EfeO family lipoprotein [Amycolatopsis sp.]
MRRSVSVLLVLGVLSAACASRPATHESSRAAVLSVAGDSHSDTGSRSPALDVSARSCAQDWVAAPAGRSSYLLDNVGTSTLAVTLIDARSGGIYAELPALAAGVRRVLPVVIPSGRYRWRCTPLRGTVSLSPVVAVTGSGGKAARPVFVLSSTEIDAAVALYSHWLSARLGRLVTDAELLERDVAAGDLDAAKADWLTAHLDYERLGAAYGTFGDLDREIDGGTSGLPGGVRDNRFTGFLRVEYGLWHGEPASALLPIAQQLVTDVQTLAKRFSGPAPAAVVASDLPLRAHEILENTLQDVLTGQRDEGSHTELATLAA